MASELAREQLFEYLLAQDRRTFPSNVELDAGRVYLFGAFSPRHLHTNDLRNMLLEQAIAAKVAVGK
eukprot:2116755-Amphidinium_carterae.1